LRRRTSVLLHHLFDGIVQHHPAQGAGAGGGGPRHQHGGRVPGLSPMISATWAMRVGFERFKKVWVWVWVWLCPICVPCSRFQNLSLNFLTSKFITAGCYPTGNIYSCSINHGPHPHVEHEGIQWCSLYKKLSCIKVGILWFSLNEQAKFCLSYLVWDGGDYSMFF
jgi:hypothetical protein